MQTERIILQEDRNVTLTAYLQEVGGEFRNIERRPALLILPGGGYQFCSDREADPVAFPYLKAGYQVFILRYSVKEDAVWPQPLEDYEQAMEIIVNRADEWNLYPDRIAVIGFSAGGHLAAAAATMGRIRPAAAILGYAVLNQDVKGCNRTAPGLVEKVDDKTPPCFLFASRTDNVVPIDNSLEFLTALSRAGISFESHIYAYGPHGFSTCDSSVQDKYVSMCDRIPRWVEDSIGWLKDVLGDFGPEGMEEALCGKRVNGDREAFLSVDCTMKKLMSDPRAMAVLEPLRKAVGQGDGEDMEGRMEMVQNMKLRDALGFTGVPHAMIAELDAQLKKLPNPSADGENGL